MVSIVIPTYNRSGLLLEALESIRNQTYKDIEVVIIDDASTDDTTERVNGFSGLHIVYHRLAKNIGYIAARNKGINLATGKYLSFLDSDDRMLPDRMMCLVSKAKETNAVFVYAGWRWMNFETGKIRVERTPDKNGRNNNLPRWCFNVVPDLVEADAMKTFGFNPQASNNENSEFLIRIFQSERVAYVEKILSEYRDHNAPRESSNVKGILTGMEYIMKQHWNFVKSEPKWVAEKYLSMALMIKKTNGSKKKSNSFFLKSIHYRPFNIRTWLHWLASFSPIK